MMISPKLYVQKHKGDSFEELIQVRDNLIESIKELEEYVYDKDHEGDQWRIHPGPDVQYQMYLGYLSEICLLLEEKYNSEIVWGEE